MNNLYRENLRNLNRTIKNAKKSPLYSKKLKNFSQLKSIKEISKLPFTTKQELRDYYPFGGLAVPFNKVIEVHTSSGTTGKTTLSFFTKKDLEIGSKTISTAWKNFGINNESRVQFIMSYGLFSGAALNTYAIQELGGFVLPSGIQPAFKQVELMMDFQIDTIVTTPSYFLYLYDYLENNNIPLNKFKLKRGIAAGEIYSEKTRGIIESKFNIKIYDHYGLCEVNTGIAYECNHRTGLHLLDDYVIAEVINPDTGDILPSEQFGELVLTSLKKEASPVIRYRTGDITRIRSGDCPCANKSIRIERIKRRIDDLIFIKGIKIDPYELKEFILDIGKGKIFSDIKILVKHNMVNYTPKILLSLKNLEDKETINSMTKQIKEKTLLNFDIEHVDAGYFSRESKNKVKFVEYVD